MKKTLKAAAAVLMTLIIVFIAASPAFSASGNELVLAENGRTDYRIVIAENAPEAEKYAARELSAYLKKMTGAGFETVTDSAPEAEKEIVIGKTIREAACPVDRSALGDDGVKIFVSGEKLFLTGGEKRGSLYAVYTLLEDYFGCRWFTNELTVTPAYNRLTLHAGTDYTFVPPFRLRQTYWAFSTASAEFCARHKLHGVMAYVNDGLGGCGEEYAVNSVHTLQWIITRDMFDTHPEYFGCDENGVRSPNRQPCLSNEDVLDITVDFALKFFEQYNTILSISQNDGMSFCQCEKCAAFNKAHGGSSSASMVNFVNRVAERVKRKYPGARLETLAYQESLTPPERLEVDGSVVIRLCPVSACVLHDLDDKTCKKNAGFNKAVKGWAKLTENIYMWNYSTNFQYYYALFPNVTTLQNRYRYFKNNNVISVFDNGCGENMMPGELHELKTYLVLKLLWNPDTDIERHINEFCDAYYGEAGKDVVEFINAFEKSVKGFKLLPFGTVHMTCQDGGESLENNTALTESEIKKLNKIISRAKGRSLSPDERSRLEGFLLGWRFFKCGTFAGEYNWFSPKADPQAEAEKLIADMKKYGIKFLSEGGGVPLADSQPDLTVRPTWWYSSKEAMPASVRTQSSLLPAVNRILRAIFFFLPDGE